MLSLKRAASAATFALVLLGGAPVAAHAAAPVTVAHCTKTSSGACIKGGEICPRAATGHKGTDAKGRVYRCKAKHWRKA